MMKTLRGRGAVCCWVALLLLGVGCGDHSNTSQDAGQPDAAPLDPHPWGDLSVEGRAFFFDLGPGLSIDYLEDGPSAELWMLEYPELRQTLGPDGRFSLAGFDEGMEVTLCVKAPGFQPTMTGTLTVGASGLADITFQVTSLDIGDAVATILLNVELDDSMCQLATTVTAADTQAMGVWAVGEPGATVALTPAVDADLGPFYFNEDVMPMDIYTETSVDGGVLYVNVPPGDYLLEGIKPGVTFSSAVLKCRAGWLVNASPPYGVQAL